MLACLPTCLFTSCQPRNFLHDFTEQCFALSDQSSCAINLTWYLFFCEFYSIIIFLVWLQDSESNQGRGYIVISSIVCWCSVEVIFFNWKLNVLSFIFLIWTEQFSGKLTKSVKISIVFLKFFLFYPLCDFRIIFSEVC